VILYSINYNGLANVVLGLDGNVFSFSSQSAQKLYFSFFPLHLSLVLEQ